MSDSGFGIVAAFHLVSFWFEFDSLDGWVRIVLEFCDLVSLLSCFWVAIFSAFESTRCSGFVPVLRLLVFADS